MRPRLRLLLPVARAAALALPASHAADKPAGKTLYHDGPEGRYLLDGTWLFRLDSADQGVKQRFMRATSTDRLDRRSTVPNAWNARRRVERVDGRRRSAGTARTSSCPSADARARTGRSASSRSTTARGCGSTASRSARTPAPTSRSSCRPTALKRRGTNRLVVRVDSRRTSTDFPPAGLNTRRRADRRLVELPRHPARGLPAQAGHGRLPAGPGPPGARRARTCAASVAASRSTLRNVDPQRRSASTVTGKFGDDNARPRHQEHRPATGSRPSRDTLHIASRGCGRPQTRSSTTSASRSASGGKKVGGLRRCTAGIRSIKVSGGRLILNGQPLNIRGVGLHEDSKAQGFAIDNARRDQLVERGQGARRDGAAHALPAAPVHRTSWPTGSGLLIWSEIPVYSRQDARYLKEPAVRAAGGRGARARTSTPTRTTRR